MSPVLNLFIGLLRCQTAQEKLQWQKVVLISDTIGGENKAGHHMILDVDIENSAMLNGSKWLAGRCEHSWVSLRRICTDELAGSSFRAVRASQARSVNQRTSNLHESLFSIPRKRVKSENPIQDDPSQCDPILIYSLETLLALSSKAVEKDLISWEEKQTNKHPKCSDHQNVFASTLGH